MHGETMKNVQVCKLPVFGPPSLLFHE